MTPYEEIAVNLNRVAQSNITSGAEPITIGARRRMNTAQHNIRMGGMDMQNKLKQMAMKIQEDEMKQEEDPLLDILGLLSAGGGVASGVQAKDKAGQNDALMRRLYSYGPEY